MRVLLLGRNGQQWHIGQIAESAGEVEYVAHLGTVGVDHAIDSV